MQTCNVCQVQSSLKSVECSSNLSADAFVQCDCCETVYCGSCAEDNRVPEAELNLLEDLKNKYIPELGRIRTLRTHMLSDCLCCTRDLTALHLKRRPDSAVEAFLGRAPSNQAEYEQAVNQLNTSEATQLAADQLFQVQVGLRREGISPITRYFLPNRKRACPF